MGITQMKRSSKKPKKPTVQTSGLLEEQADLIGHRMLLISSIAAAAGSLLLLGMFFSSDVRGNILAAKATPVYAETSNNTNQEKAQDLVSVLQDPHTSREDVAALLSRMRDEDFKTFVERITERAEVGKVKTATTDTEGLYDSLTRGELTTKSDIIAHLDKMDETEFMVFIKAMMATIQPDASDVSLKTGLDEAYAEAEARYPGQIDGSKRLKLVKDLNATDYLYYVAEEGDTLLELSRSFDVPLGQLVELNGIHDADVIPAGMILLFPTDTEQPDLEANDK